jgi:uncharacterized protein (TIGR00251 family)
MVAIRIPVRVKTGASRAKVGGRFGEDRLVVAVTARPVDGAANEAVVRAVAEAFGVRLRQVSLVSGHTARSKVLEITVADDDTLALRATLGRLLGPT